MADQQFTSPGPLPEPRPSEPMFNVPAVVLWLIALMAAIHALTVYYLSPQQQLVLYFEAAFIPARQSLSLAEAGGEWFWTPVTYSLLHGGWAHFALNSFWLAAFGSLVARRIGVGRFLLFWVLAALASALMYLAFHLGENSVMVGASGVVSGLMGAAARFAFSRQAGLVRQNSHLARRLSLSEALANRTVLAFLSIWFGINALAAMGFSAGAADAIIAWEAHIGGFLFGFLAFPLFDPLGPDRSTTA